MNTLKERKVWLLLQFLLNAAADVVVTDCINGTSFRKIPLEFLDPQKAYNRRRRRGVCCCCCCYTQQYCNIHCSMLLLCSRSSHNGN